MVQNWDRDAAEGFWSDLHQEIYGRKAYRMDFSKLSDAELDDSIEYMMNTGKRAIAGFEAAIAEYMAIGSINRATAIRWIKGGCYESNIEREYGLPFDYVIG